MQYSKYPHVIPAPVKLATALILAYAFLILLRTVLYGMQANFSDSYTLGRGLLRVAGMTGIGLWLLTLNNTARRFAVISCGFLAAVGIVGLVMLVLAGLALDETLLLFAMESVIPVYCLAHATFILTRPSTRAAFQGTTRTPVRRYDRAGVRRY